MDPSESSTIEETYKDRLYKSISEIYINSETILNLYWNDGSYLIKFTFTFQVKYFLIMNLSFFRHTLE